MVETATPTFLVETLFQRRVSSLTLDHMIGSNDLLSALDVDRIATEALLFQTGYLTIRQTERRGGETYYRLGYPNREVRQSLNRSLLNHMMGSPPRIVEHRARLYDLLAANDFERLESLFRAFFAVSRGTHLPGGEAAHRGLLDHGTVSPDLLLPQHAPQDDEAVAPELRHLCVRKGVVVVERR